MYLICIWVDENVDEYKFETAIPLLFLGKWLKENKCEEEFHIIFLYGKTNLSEEYLSRLENIDNYQLFSYEKDYKGLLENYSLLRRFGQYESNCFLRWLLSKAPR